MTVFASLVILFSGCSKETFPKEGTGNGLVTFHAKLPGDATKTSIDGKDNTKVNWSKDDVIDIYCLWVKAEEDTVGLHAPFTLSKGQGTPKGSFMGSVTSEPLYGFYPYNQKSNCENGKIYVNLPTKQTVAEGTFDPKAALMVGVVCDTTINFSHAVAYLRVTAPTDVTGLRSITIQANDETQLTGDAALSPATCAYSPIVDSWNYVTGDENN